MARVCSMAACASRRIQMFIRASLFDLPQVAALAQDRFERAGIAARATIVSGIVSAMILCHLGQIRCHYPHPRSLRSFEDETRSYRTAEIRFTTPLCLKMAVLIVIAEPMFGRGIRQIAARMTRISRSIVWRWAQAQSADQPSKSAELLSKAGFARVSQRKNSSV